MPQARPNVKASKPAADAWQRRAMDLRSRARTLSASVRHAVPMPAKVPCDPRPVFRAGAAEVDITPRKPMYLDGYWNHRLSTGVHSPLYAKAIVLDDGRTRVGLVVLDLIAFYNEWVRDARGRQDAVKPENVTICTTHTHSSPCMLGVFGPPGKSVDTEYVHWVKDRAAEALRKAAANLRPARLGFAQGELPVQDGAIADVAVNWHNPGVVEAGLPVMRLEEAETRKPIATLVNFGNHPDVLGDKTTLVSSDCFHYIRENVGAGLRGVALVFNRACGGIEPIGQGANEMDVAEGHMKRIGRVVADQVVAAMRNVEWLDAPRVSARRVQCAFPVLSEEMVKASVRGLLPVTPGDDGGTRSEMTLIEVGSAQLLTVPGEVHPEVAFKLLDMMPAKYRFILSMGDDEIGYIVPGELYNPKGIQELLSTGPDNERVVMNGAARLLGVGGYIEPECIEGMRSRLPE